jgi:hypothetical protein
MERVYIEPNLPNMISVTIMAVVGIFLLSFVTKGIATIKARGAGSSGG